MYPIQILNWFRPLEFMDAEKIMSKSFPNYWIEQSSPTGEFPPALGEKSSLNGSTSRSFAKSPWRSGGLCRSSTPPCFHSCRLPSEHRNLEVIPDLIKPCNLHPSRRKPYRASKKQCPTNTSPRILTIFLFPVGRATVMKPRRTRIHLKSLSVRTTTWHMRPWHGSADHENS